MYNHGAYLGVPGPAAIAVALGETFRTALSMLSANLGRNLGIHDPPHRNLQGFPQKVPISVLAALA